MKKLLVLLFTIHCSLFAAHADEGMWTLYNLPNAVYETMKQENYELPYGALYQGDDAVKNCVVLFGGYCSGVVVSPDGLVFTNHHCGFEAIRSHSTVEHDYMLNGFVSNSYEEELPNKDLYVSFMIEQRDVTRELDSLGLNTLSEDKRGHFVDSLENVYQKQLSAQDSTLRAELKPYYDIKTIAATTSVTSSMSAIGEASLCTRSGWNHLSRIFSISPDCSIRAKLSSMASISSLS